MAGCRVQRHTLGCNVRTLRWIRDEYPGGSAEHAALSVAIDAIQPLALMESIVTAMRRFAGKEAQGTGATDEPGKEE